MIFKEVCVIGALWVENRRGSPENSGRHVQAQYHSDENKSYNECRIWF